MVPKEGSTGLLGILSQAATVDLIPEETSSHYLSYATYYESEIVMKVLGICSVMSDSFYNPMDYSPAGSSVHGISQAKRLEWVAIPTQGSNPRLLHYRRSLSSEPPGLQ